MKKSLITVVTAGILILFVLVSASCQGADQGQNMPTEKSSEAGNAPLAVSTAAQPSSGNRELDKNQLVSETENTDNIDNPDNMDNPDLPPASMADSLFIGDSRTVGIMEYAGLNEADYFCSTGMNVFEIYEDSVSVPSIGKVTLTELLSLKDYRKIYVMLGINELGYDFQSIVEEFGGLIEFVRENQPDAAVFIQANLHVSKKRSDSDSYINNQSINKLNSELSKFADNKHIFFIDANYLFDDEGGNLSADKTSDEAHLYAKLYAEWGDWICKETALVMEGTELDR